MKRTFKEFCTEAAKLPSDRKLAVIIYGRFNPPTVAHEQAFSLVESTAKANSGDGFIIPTHTVDTKKNPLSFPEKKDLIKTFTKKRKLEIIDNGITIVEALKHLSNVGYTQVMHVAGSDRIDCPKTGFRQLIEKYNGKPTKTGSVEFSFDKYTFVSAGERDPDSDDEMAAMSASKLRKLAVQGDYESFARGLISTVSDRMMMETFNTIRTRLGVDIP